MILRFLFFIFLVTILIVFVIVGLIGIYRNKARLLAKKAEQKIELDNTITDKKIETIEKTTKKIKEKIKNS